jgi:lysozyme family protein
MKRLLVILIFTLSLFCEVTAASFEEAMSFTLKMEGSTIDKTNGKIHSKYGITKETLNKFNKKYKTNLQLTTLSKTNASKVAKKLLWDIYKLDNVHNNIVGIAMFDLLFNSNPSTLT